MRLSKILLSCCMLGLCLVPGGALADGKKITFGIWWQTSFMNLLP